MKSPVIVVLLLCLQSLAYFSCKKDFNPVVQIKNIPPKATYNTAPKVSAGPDIMLTLPDNEIILNGTFLDAEQNVKEISWAKISGPDSFKLENKNLAHSKLSNLVKGEYQFEFTATDSLGLYAKDTVNITVSDLPSNPGEIILRDRTWIFPWYSSIEIEDFYNKVPAGRSFRVFIQRDTSPGWMEVTPISDNAVNASYEYFIENRLDGAGMYNYGSLYIFNYGGDVSDTPDVKIVY